MSLHQTAFSHSHLPVIVGDSRVGMAEGFLHPMIIDPEFKALIPPLAPEERAQLEANILADGCRDPLVVWRGILIDGHNRFAICSKHGLEFQTVEREFKDQSHVIEWIIRNQFGRRNLSAYERTKLALRLEGVIAGRAEQRMKAGKAQDPSQKSEQGKTSQEIAKAAGVSHDTVAKVKKIEAQAAPEVKSALSAGTMSINQAAEIAQLPVETQREIASLPTRKEIVEEIMTPTPRTDAIAHRGLGSVAYIAEMTDFARQLERELAVWKHDVKLLEAELQKFDQAAIEWWCEYQDLKAQAGDDRAEIEQIKATLANPHAVHVNMLRGTIQWTPANLRHLLGET